MTTAVVATDHELVEAARAGDDRAFEELYARYRRPIAGYCQRLTQDADRADDITQEVFISAFRRLRASDRPIVFRPWIYEIARNACIDEYRRRSRVREISIDRDEDAPWAGPVAVSPPPEVAVESKQLLEDLRGAFRGLSERHHRIIVLRELEGLSYSQIGDQLGMSKMVVESTLFRARRRLSEEYEDLASGRRCEYVLGMIAADGTRPVKRLGLRDRRALSRHLEHCQSCRREARARDLEQLGRGGLVGKVAVLLPIPLLRLHGRWAARASGATQSVLPAMNSATGSSVVASLAGSGRAVAAAATLFAAAVGGGVATGVVDHGGLLGSGPAAVRSATAMRGAAGGEATALTGGHAIRASLAESAPGGALGIVGRGFDMRQTQVAGTLPTVGDGAGWVGHDRSIARGTTSSTAASSGRSSTQSAAGGAGVPAGIGGAGSSLGGSSSGLGAGSQIGGSPTGLSGTGVGGSGPSLGSGSGLNGSGGSAGAPSGSIGSPTSGLGGTAGGGTAGSGGSTGGSGATSAGTGGSGATSAGSVSTAISSVTAPTGSSAGATPANGTTTIPSTSLPGIG